MILKTGSKEINLMTGDNVTDYVCVQTWDPIFECVRYHYVHNSVKDPNGYVKSLNPNELIFNSGDRNGRV